MSFWQGRRVLITGHTGFKGGWLALYLSVLGADVSGYALAPDAEQSFYSVTGLEKVVRSNIGDICDLDRLKAVISGFRPEVIFHLAAQPLVRESYKSPLETYRVNVMGSLAVLEAARASDSVRSIVMITTDKCYENKEWVWGYRETDALGGYDPYSSSKACAELAVASWRQSFFPVDRLGAHQVGIATVRAGNVIGGGDWSVDRLVPDIIRSLLRGCKPVLRNPASTRPWQHVLEPLRGYVDVAEGLFRGQPKFATAFNFGPRNEDIRSVEWVARRLMQIWGLQLDLARDSGPQPHEANTLKLDWSKAKATFGWSPRFSLNDALQNTVHWYRACHEGQDMRKFTIAEIQRYQALLLSTPAED